MIIMENIQVDCKLTIQDLQLIYLLLEKESKLTDKHLVDTIKDKKVTADFYESLPRITHRICEECSKKVFNDLNQPDIQNRNDKSQLTIERRL